MKFRQKIVLFLVIVVVDLILCGVTLRMWKGEDGEKDFKGDVYHKRNEEGNESGVQENRKDRNVMSRESDMVREKETDMRKYVALTFDDGPNSRYTKPLLDGLRERGIRASFFLVGECIDGKEDLVKQMAEDGHLIGNHSQKHMQLTAEAVKDACSQIQWTNEKIQAITGESPQYIRPPYGSWSEELECVVPMTVILWDIDPLDWKVQDTRQIVDHVVKRVQDGNIILLHDSYETSVEAALEIIDTLSANGYNFVTADELVIE